MGSGAGSARQTLTKYAVFDLAEQGQQGRTQHSQSKHLWIGILEHGRGIRISHTRKFNNVSLTTRKLSQATMNGYQDPSFAEGSFDVAQHVHSYTSEVLPLILKHCTT